MLSGIGKAGDVLSSVGQPAAGGATALRDERFKEDEAKRERDRIALQAAGLGVTQNASRDSQALDRAKFGMDADMARTKQAAFGDGLANVQDVNIDFGATTGALPKFNVTGGLRPSLYGPNARQAGGELSRQALLALMSGSDTPAASGAIAMPELSDPQGAGVLENTLGGVGLAGGLAGGVLDMLKKRKVATMDPSFNKQTGEYS